MKVNAIVVKDLTEKLDSGNVVGINYYTELNFEDTENVTYQNLIDARFDSLGSFFGMPKKKNGVDYWVFPINASWGLYVDPLSENVKEYTSDTYKKEIKPLWDVEEIEL